MALHLPNTATLTLFALVPLVAWRSYARFKRNVGRQKLSKYRPWITLIVIPAILLLFVFAIWTHPERLPLLLGGLVGGSLLARFGLRKTKFDSSAPELYYTPNARIGIALSSLFVVRILYRIVEVYSLNPTMPRGLDDFARSPMTLVVFGLVAGYYVVYALGLLRWRSEVRRSRNLDASSHDDSI
jgi:hypothetical protein